MASNVGKAEMSKFAEVQDLLERNRIIIMQVNSNHARRTNEALALNHTLLEELNSNVHKVAEIYEELQQQVLGEGPASDPNGS